MNKYSFDDICLEVYNAGMEKWSVLFHEEFEVEFDAFPVEVQDALLAALLHLRHSGPDLGRPFADSLEGSAHSNMKELRFDAALGVWRAAFAFDPNRRAVVLVAGDKRGANQKKFYKKLIKVADHRFKQWKESLRE
jgi:hypothetical protein